MTAASKAPSTAALPPISVFIPAMLVPGVFMDNPPVSYTIPVRGEIRGNRSRRDNTENKARSDEEIRGHDSFLESN